MKPGTLSPKHLLPDSWDMDMKATYVHVRIVEAKLSSAIAEPLRDILTNLKSQGIHKVMLEDAVEDWRLSTAQIISMLDSLRQYDFFDMRLALYSPSRGHSDDLRFLETAAINRGYEVGFFSDVHAAESWLLEAETLSGKPF